MRERAALFQDLGTSEAGLSREEAKRRQETYGKNSLPTAKPEHILSIFLRQFKSPLIYVLLGACGVVFYMGERVDALVILAVLVINAVIGSAQEGRAQNTLRALRSFVDTKATVLRGGVEMILSDADIVPGDIVLLQEGEKIPADVRFFIAHNLQTDESSLTGESQPVAKTADTLTDESVPITEQKNMGFKGTNVVAGNAFAVVVATGADTEIGSIAVKIAKIDTEIPLQADIRALSRLIIAAVAFASALIFLYGLAVGFSLREMFATVVSLAVSIIPEGLPVVMTMVLATGVWRMSKRNALVKRLQAVEALGQARVVAVDKTGTLTRNELVVQRAYAGGSLFTAEGEGYDSRGRILKGDSPAALADEKELMRLGAIAALSANARIISLEGSKRWQIAGDPTEAAMLVFAQKLGLSKETLEAEMPLVEDVPFESRLKYHAMVRVSDGEHALSMVGAPETILERSAKVCQGGRTIPLSDKKRRELEDMFLSFSAEGLRVIGIAERRGTARVSPEDPKELVFVGFLGMKDGLRKEVPEAMRRAREAGIKVVMITGDHRITAQAIGKEAGIYREGDGVLTGPDIDSHSDLALREKIAGVSVFARVTPEHKLRIIEAYRARGIIIAMTGDGVNDAPSLVAADLGVAMGGIGTEVAKEASDIVLLDDNFGSIVSAVEEGRSIYKTIQKVILYLFSTSIGELFTIAGALFVGLPLPLLPTQIIWLNFVTDGFLTVALAMEPKEKNLLAGRFARAGRYLIDAGMFWRICFLGFPMAVGTLIVFSAYTGDMAKALTMSLTVLAVFQWFNAWNCRSESHSAFGKGMFANRWLIAATALVVLAQAAVVYTPFLQKIFHTTALSLSEWLLVVPVAASIILIEEVRKFFVRRAALRRGSVSSLRAQSL